MQIYFKERDWKYMILFENLPEAKEVVKKSISSKRYAEKEERERFIKEIEEKILQKRDQGRRSCSINIPKSFLIEKLIFTYKSRRLKNIIEELEEKNFKVKQKSFFDTYYLDIDW